MNRELGCLQFQQLKPSHGGRLWHIACSKPRCPQITRNGKKFRLRKDQGPFSLIRYYYQRSNSRAKTLDGVIWRGRGSLACHVLRSEQLDKSFSCLVYGRNNHEARSTRLRPSAAGWQISRSVLARRLGPRPLKSPFSAVRTSELIRKYSLEAHAIVKIAKTGDRYLGLNQRFLA